MRIAAALLIVLLSAGCRVSDSDTEEQAAPAAEQDGRVATAYASGSDRLSREELEANRLNMDWREFIERDTTAGAAGDTTADGQPSSDESWDDITMESINSGPAALPLYGDVEGPSVLRVQILLDRALFSPGVMDGRWGSNTEKAVYWMQRREGLRPTGHVDPATWERLQQLAGQTGQLVRTKQLTADDVAGPFVTLPEEYYDRRDMDCQCYESLAEKLAEVHHTTEELLAKLNPDLDLNNVQAGTSLNVPAVDRQAPPAMAQGPGSQAQRADTQAQRSATGAGDTAGARATGQTGAPGGVAKIVISDGGRYLHALDASGRILYHFPATLGSDYSPSPTGDYRITNIAHDPTWHYQPDLLEGVDDDEPDAVLPAGPNNAVGVVWMQLSRPHYGIHGTSAPETIGYATSNGCVRLTNWDAKFLAERTGAGTPVEFRDVR
ncbi:MAG TPA: L,D-transpeptidase family protein [Longimicrobiales bacterium]|nr:L,D-transpeptidase family protein [Longimicrobiales bacterium]